MCSFIHVLFFSHCVLSDSFATPLTVPHKVPLSVGFFRQEYWRGLQFPTLGDHLDPGIEPGSAALQANSLPLSHQGKPSFTLPAPCRWWCRLDVTFSRKLLLALICVAHLWHAPSWSVLQFPPSSSQHRTLIVSGYLSRSPKAGVSDYPSLILQQLGYCVILNSYTKLHWDGTNSKKEKNRHKDEKNKRTMLLLTLRKQE